MTRKSKRELERALDDIDNGGDDPITVVIQNTVIATGSETVGGDAEPGDVIEESEEVIEL